MKSDSRQQAINSFISRIKNDGSIFVDEIICSFDQEEALKEKALDYLFHEFSAKQGDEHITLIKVACINDLYSTRLNSTSAPER